MFDYIHQNVYGTWEQIKNHPIANTYQGFEKLNFAGVFFALNIQRLDPAKIPTAKFKKIIISYHTEYVEHYALWDFFQQNHDCKFLFLSDTGINDLWPSNVTSCQWITWGQQLDVAIEYHSIVAEPIVPKYKISSLSNRHEFHKAATTAYLLETCDTSEMILSWHNWCPIEPYYKNSGMYIPDQIQKYLLGKFQSVDSIKLPNDGPFNMSPITNGNWNHPAYIECAINITNESVYNSTTHIDDVEVSLPTPYLTEKTWKPLLAGRPFIPVGQAGTLSALEKLGLNFEYELDVSFDLTIPDFDRMIKIYDCLEHVIELSASEIYHKTIDATMHNLNCLKTRQFQSRCNTVNAHSIEWIKLW